MIAGAPGLPTLSVFRTDAQSAVIAPEQPLRRPGRGDPSGGREAPVRAAAAAAPGRPKVIAVMPAYNAERTLGATIADMPEGSVDEVILVDDGSTDRTVALARELGLTVLVHARNLGYGANQKTCYREALARGADVVVMIHPDYQYDSRSIPAAVSIIGLGTCDVVLGNRIRSRPEALGGGMPSYKYVFNRLLTLTENLLLGQNLGDFHSGFRVMRREVLERIPFERNSDDFLFDSQFLFQAVRFGFRLGDIPVPVRYFDEASSINFGRSVVYGLGTLAMLGLYWLDRLRIVRSRLFAPKA
jgi:glycosyltransferase involved in cell wall biosynthesis